MRTNSRSRPTARPSVLPHTLIIPEGESLHGSQESGGKRGAATGDILDSIQKGAYSDGDMLIWDIDAFVPYNVDNLVRWVFPYVDGTYDKNVMTRQGEYTMISNKGTSDYPFPITVGGRQTLMSTASFAELAYTGVVSSGQRYTFSEYGYVTKLFAYAPELTATTTYRILIVDETDPLNPKTSVIAAPVLVEDGWVEVALGQTLVYPGSVILILIDVLNSGTSTTVTGGWTYNGVSNAGAPSNQGWNNRVQQDVVRISDTDLDSVNRDTELSGIIPTSTINFVETADPTNFLEYTTTGVPVDQGVYYEYPTSLSNTGGTLTAGTVTTMTATIPVAQSTKYVIDTDFWLSGQPAWANIEGVLRFDSVDQSGQEDNGFGIDIEFQLFQVSPDWDTVAISNI